MLEVLEMMKWYQLLHVSRDLKLFMGATCSFVPKLCAFLENGYFDIKHDLDDPDREPVLFSHGPAGTGYHALLHYMQIARSERF